MAFLALRRKDTRTRGELRGFERNPPERLSDDERGSRFALTDGPACPARCHQLPDGVVNRGAGRNE